MRSYAIGDIHGHLDLLQTAHRRIAADRARVGDDGAPVIHVGDYVDRGPDNSGVIDFLVAGQARGENWVTLKGNHDRMFAGFLDDPHWHDPMLRPEFEWLHPRIGGIETLGSYGVANPGGRPRREVHAEALEKVPAAHRTFLAGLADHYRRGEVYFAHAGIRPGVALDDQVEDDLIWIRDLFLNDPRDHGVLVVHGHSPVERATHFGNRVDIDTGAAYDGPLTAVVIEGREVWTLTDDGRQKLMPTA